MARRKGIPNRGGFSAPGLLKTDTIKLRTSQEWLDILNEAAGKVWLLNGRTQSELIRILVMEGLQRHLYQEEHKDIRDRIQKVIEAH